MDISDISIEYEGYVLEVSFFGGDADYSVYSPKGDCIDSGTISDVVDTQETLEDLLEQIEPFNNMESDYDQYVTDITRTDDEDE